MPALGIGDTSNCTTPRLDLFTKLGGSFVDVTVLEFQIFEKVTNPAAPVQVFPPSGRATVDVTNDCPIGERISTGHYVATYTVPDTALVGTHEIRWFFKLTPTSPETLFREEFEVLAGPIGLGNGMYTTIVAMREEGVPASVSDDRIVAAILLASRMVDKFTGQFFEPRNMTFTLDGNQHARLLLEQPIIAVTEVILDPESVLSLGSLFIYNRHITENLLHPDDRRNPRIEIDQPLEDELLFKVGLKVFPRGQQNIQITGVFGYTDYDGTATGSTPPAIDYVTRLIALEYIPQLQGTDPTDGVAMTSTLIELRTRDQWVRFAEPNKRGFQGPGPFFGDRRIDNILMAYRRPPLMRSV